ncbi:MAG: AAA family ATPase [Lentisphaeria bacterium]|nr:AAA family ATPase [Lentisphaeria bacterium]
MKTLFDHAREKILEKEQPLAARMRPRTLDDYVGQTHILAPGRLLRRAIQADQLSSLIFYGPPGTGKTTLASVIANTTKSHFTVLNAVLAGKADIRTAIDEAQRRLGERSRRTILFVDEVHRWNKAQQDALLPWVENGTLILIGATTENPYFSVNRALVSRSRVFQLKPLNDNELRQVAAAAITDTERGFGNLRVDVAADALDHLVNVASGDARAVLNALELAVETTPPDDDGVIHIDLAVAEDSIQQRAVLYDQEGDYHFDIISAFIKSMRGSDPDAAVYWLAKMVYAGEDPRFLFRRMVIFAAEDVGLADPDALRVVNAAADAFDRVGMPEGRYHLGMAALYLATAPKSNSVFAFFDALSAVAKEADAEVPNHLRDASRDKESFGHGKGYLYPHAYRDHWVAQQYLPKSLQGRLFYQPGETGYEKHLRDNVARRREAQLAAVLETGMDEDGETLSYSTIDKQFDSWLERSMGGTAKRLETIRQALFETAACQRHHTVFILNDDTGLLTWEAVRQTPEGGVWVHMRTPEGLERAKARLRTFPALRAPELVLSPDLEPASIIRLVPTDVRFDRVFARGLLATWADPAKSLSRLVSILAPGGRIVIVRDLPGESRRLHEILPLDELAERVRKSLIDCEEAVCRDRHGGEDTLTAWAAAAGLTVVKRRHIKSEAPLVITGSLLDRWFGAGDHFSDGSYSRHLLSIVAEDDLKRLARAARRGLAGRTVTWRSHCEALALETIDSGALA